MAHPVIFLNPTGKAEIRVGASPDLFKKQLAPSCFKNIGLDVLRKEIVKKTILKSRSFKNIGPANC